MGVAGLRKAGNPVKVELGDKWHLGSCTKSMTATLAATFVEEGIISWETTVGEALGKQLKMLKGYESATLGLLLANRGGVPGKLPDSVFDSVDQSAQLKDLSSRDMLKQRIKYAEAVWNVAPASPPGSRYEYSNSGFVVAGVMLELLAGKPWEKLIEERIFKPLGMTDSGFGSRRTVTSKLPRSPGHTKMQRLPSLRGPATTTAG